MLSKDQLIEEQKAWNTMIKRVNDTLRSQIQELFAAQESQLKLIADLRESNQALVEEIFEQKEEIELLVKHLDWHEG
jgi:transposase